LAAHMKIGVGLAIKCRAELRENKKQQQDA
jgi:hypothetical protein